MLANEKISIAAHLHVLLRRKTGRVTDTEWMATNRDYALEIVRFARERAVEDGNADLATLANRLADIMAIPGAASSASASSAASRAAQAKAPPDSGFGSGFGPSVIGKDFSDSELARERKPRDAPRYVAGLR